MVNDNRYSPPNSLAWRSAGGPKTLTVAFWTTEGRLCAKTPASQAIKENLIFFWAILGTTLKIRGQPGISIGSRSSGTVAAGCAWPGNGTPWWPVLLERWMALPLPSPPLRRICMRKLPDGEACGNGGQSDDRFRNQALHKIGLKAGLLYRRAHEGWCPLPRCKAIIWLISAGKGRAGLPMTALSSSD